MNPDPPLDVAHLAALCRACRWMRRSRNWKDRLLYRLAQAHLDLLTQQALEGGVPREEKKWTQAVKKG